MFQAILWDRLVRTLESASSTSWYATWIFKVYQLEGLRYKIQNLPGSPFSITVKPGYKDNKFKFKYKYPLPTIFVYGVLRTTCRQQENGAACFSTLHFVWQFLQLVSHGSPLSGLPAPFPASECSQGASAWHQLLSAYTLLKFTCETISIKMLQ